jgi:branched-chain amino acid aminotransferase
MLLASVDGAIGSADEARIPVTDDGLLRGDGAFEGLRVYGGRPYGLDAHLARLRRSCAGLRLDADFAALEREIAGVLAAAGPVQAALRIVLTRGGRRIILVEPLPHYAPLARVMTVTYAPSRVLDGLKTISYAGNMLAKRLAQEQGFDDALLVTPHGRILEGATSTFFWARDGSLFTPPLEDRILPSITRQTIDAIEESCTLDDLAGAQEAFLASSVREVQPLAAIDDLRLPAAPGPLTLQARERLSRAIEEELGSV